MAMSLQVVRSILTDKLSLEQVRALHVLPQLDLLRRFIGYHVRQGNISFDDAQRYLEDNYRLMLWEVRQSVDRRGINAYMRTGTRSRLLVPCKPDSVINALYAKSINAMRDKRITDINIMLSKCY